MARTVKAGLQYFPLDVDFFNDDKIELISSQFGCKGESIAIRLLCLVYRNGYYYQWGQDESLLFAKRVSNGITHELVNDVVNGLIKRAFFDKSIFDSFGILTSRGIQKRYIEAKDRAKEVVFFEELLLIDNNEALKNNNVTFISINDNICTQRKEKKRKEEKSKVKASPDDAAIIFPFESESFKIQWQHWKEYKQKEHRFSYKSPQSEQASLYDLSKISSGVEQTATEIIHQSMANGWKGFFELKKDKNGKKQPASEVSTQSAFDKIDRHFTKNGG